MTLAIFPGTFNPVHIGHLMLAETALLQFGLQKVLFIISPNPPNKLNSKDVIPVERRVQLLEVALAGNLRFALDQRELKRAGPSYTVQTVQEVRQEYKLNTKVSLILGLDAFLSLHSWHKADELGSCCKFLVASRPGWDKQEVEDSVSSFHDDLDWVLLENPPLAISSTQIRMRKKENKSYRYLLPTEVFELYKGYP